MAKRAVGGQKFFVSRQRYWGVDEEEASIVEIAIGGSDYANADMLGAKWKSLGEGKEFADPREAVNAAIAICEAWRTTGEKHAKVAMGATGGFSMPFEGEDFDALRKRAEEMYDKLPKCVRCGELLGETVYNHIECTDREEFCSENCAVRHYYDLCAPEETEDECPTCGAMPHKGPCG